MMDLLEATMIRMAFSLGETKTLRLFSVPSCILKVIVTNKNCFEIDQMSIWICLLFGPELLVLLVFYEAVEPFSSEKEV